MNSPTGLVDCAADWGTAFCITKTIESFLSLCLIIWIVVEMVNYYHYVKVIKSSFIFIVQILMILTLTFNIAFALYHNIYPLLYLEVYFTNMYFVVLCYYLIYNVFKSIKWARMLIAGFIGLLTLVFILILIDSFIQNLQICKELSYLVTYSVGLLACIVMFAAYRFNQVKEIKRIQKFNKMMESDENDIKEGPSPQSQFLKLNTPSKVNFNMPFKNIWMLIICNILSRMVGLAQSLVFEFDWNKNGGNNCMISQVNQFQNTIVNYVVTFVFALFTLYLGFVSTIWVFRQKRKAKDQFHLRTKSPSNFSSIASGKNILQMVAQGKFEKNYSNQASNLSDLYSKRSSHRQNRNQQQNNSGFE